MTNAEKILRLLDDRLTTKVELTLYGRAALQLGFNQPRPEYANSLDVDVILWLGQAEELLAEGNFWDAVNTVNRLLAGEYLYISHFFEETQVILRPAWRETRVPIRGTWEHLNLYRLANEDLFLSKLMRYDPIDLDDARFIRDQSAWTREYLGQLIHTARIPDIPEVRHQFELCVKELVG